MTTIAVALMARSDLAKRAKQLRQRVAAHAKCQEGEEPQEDPNELLQELQAVLIELEELSTRINAANQRIELPGIGTMSAALGRRDRLRALAAALNGTSESAIAVPDLYGSREVRWVPQVSVPELRKQYDAVAKEVRELNGQIQAANWRHDL